ncbi:MAG: hypothetical protein ABJM43_14085 [Paracoccaceae bacterium]
MMQFLLFILLDPICVLAAVSAALFGLERACVRTHDTCPVRVCDTLSKKGPGQ